MNTGVIRAFALGTLFATAIIGTIYYTQSTTLTKSQLDAALAKNGLITISEKEYKQLKEAAKQAKQSAVSIKRKPTATTPPKTIHIYHLVIEKGDVPTKFAKELEEAKVISDAQALMNYLETHQLTRDIRAGTYEIRSDMSYEEIGHILTGKKR
jgi:hypothetical protein